MYLLFQQAITTTDADTAMEWDRVIFAMKCCATLFLAFLMQPLPRAQRNRAIRRIAAWEIGRPGYLYAPSFVTPWIRSFQKRETGTNYHSKSSPTRSSVFRHIVFVSSLSVFLSPKRIKRSSIELSYHTFSPLRNNLKSKKWE